MNIKAVRMHMITIGMAVIVVMGTTGCSVIMGIFGPEETVTTDSESTDATPRTLMPTPALTVDVEATPTDESVEPTPTAQPEASSVRSSAETAAPQPAQEEQKPPSRMVTITGEAVNLRSQPSTDGEILATVPNGTTFALTDQNDSGDWYQICCVNNTTAWVFGELVSVEEPAVAVAPITENAPVNSAPAVTDNTTKTTENVAPAVTIDIPLVAPVFSQSAVSDGTRYEYTEQGFAITLPTGWQPIDLSAERMADSLHSLASENPQAATLVEGQLQSLINARFALYAAELTPAVLDAGFATNVSLLRQPLPPGISLDFYSQIMAKQAQERFALISPVSITPGSLPAGKSVTLNYTISGPNGGLAVVEYLIMQGKTVYDLKFTTTASQSDVYIAAFVTIAESFKLLDQ